MSAVKMHPEKELLHSAHLTLIRQSTVGAFFLTYTELGANNTMKHLQENRHPHTFAMPISTFSLLDILLFFFFNVTLDLKLHCPPHTVHAAFSFIFMLLQMAGTGNTPHILQSGL